jgi:hypothetical protein
MKTVFILEDSVDHCGPVVTCLIGVYASKELAIAHLKTYSSKLYPREEFDEGERKTSGLSCFTRDFKSGDSLSVREHEVV